MKVTYLVTEYPSVSHSFIRREILALERRGVDVQRLAVRGQDTILVDDEDRRERQRTRYLLDKPVALVGAAVGMAVAHPVRFLRSWLLASRLGTKPAQRGVLFHWMYLLEACLAARWVAQFGAVHVHAHFGTNSAAVAMLVASLTGRTFSFTVHGTDDFDNPVGIGLPEKIRRASFVAAVSSFGRSQLFRWADRADWPKLHVVRCGLDRKFLADPATPVPSNHTFVCVGRLSAEKGHFLLLHALRRVLDSGTECRLVLAGDGELRPDVEALIDELDLTEHVRITGWISSDQVRDEIIAARGFVLASFAEGLPVVIMEAMALGRPVLATPVGGIPELVIPGRTGWLTPAGDEESLASAMLDCLATSAAQLETMGQAGAETIRRLHDVESSAADLTKLFLGAEIDSLPPEA